MEYSSSYFTTYLQNYSLKNFEGEEWKEIPGYENYLVSNFGRLKSRERITLMPQNRKRTEPEKIMRLFVLSSPNKYLGTQTYHVVASLGKEGTKKRFSVARLVYYLFVEPFDLQDTNLIVSYKDSDSLHMYYTNLELLTIAGQRQKMFAKDRAKSWKSDQKQAILQLDIEGNQVGQFDSIFAAEKITGINSGSIYMAVMGQSFTAGGFRWQLADPQAHQKMMEARGNTPRSQPNLSEFLFNEALWKHLGSPEVDRTHPPAGLNLSLHKMENESWKPIPGYEGLYEISNWGRVKKLAGWSSSPNKTWLPVRIMALRLTGNQKSGKEDQLYLSVSLTKEGHKKKIMVARILYYCFIAPFDLTNRSLIVRSSGDLLQPSPEKMQLLTVRQARSRKMN